MQAYADPNFRLVLVSVLLHRKASHYQATGRMLISALNTMQVSIKEENKFASDFTLVTDKTETRCPLSSIARIGTCFQLRSITALCVDGFV